MAVPAQQLAPRPRVLLADDERVTRRLLEGHITRFGYDVVSVDDGLSAWNVLKTEDAPSLVVMDWAMPGLDGPEVCRRIRASLGEAYTYILLVTARATKSDVVEGLSAGADDFVSKPIDPEELRARLRTGERIVQLERTLASRLKELAATIEHVHELQGILPICIHCKRIRSQEQLWEKVESYFERRTGAKFGHALCAECLELHYPDGK